MVCRDTLVANVYHFPHALESLTQLRKARRSCCIVLQTRKGRVGPVDDATKRRSKKDSWVSLRRFNVNAIHLEKERGGLYPSTRRLGRTWARTSPHPFVVLDQARHCDSEWRSAASPNDSNSGDGWASELPVRSPQAPSPAGAPARLNGPPPCTPNARAHTHTHAHTV